jgi:PiT family inorganic phosphate transporter
MIVVFTLAIIGALFMTFRNDANDATNAFAAAASSKIIKLTHALDIAAALNLAGVILLGGKVSSTLIDGVMRLGTLHDVQRYNVQMISCLIAAQCFVILFTQTGLPVSSTHTIVGSMTEVALVMGGIHSINRLFLASSTVSWICSLLAAAACSLGMIKLIRMVIFDRETDQIRKRMCRWTPILGCLALTIGAICVQWRTPLHRHAEAKHLKLPFIFLILPATYCFLHVTAMISRGSEYGVERIFRRFQAGTSCLVGFAIGLNDVANCIAPVLVIDFMMKNNGTAANFNQCTIPVWRLAIGGLGTSEGVIAFGHKVIHTLGHKITLLTSSRGFSADFASAATIILSSTFGLPCRTGRL